MSRFLFAALGLCAALHAQSDRGTITGLVSDPSGAAVAGARITALNNETGVLYSTETSASGNYTVPQLPIGVYELRVEASGFRRFIQRNIRVSIAQTLNIPVSLELGAVEQAIEVSAAVTQLESATSDLGAVVNKERVIDLPLAVSGGIRNPEAFAFLTPGVTGDAGNTQINGSQSRAKEVMFDGISSTTPESGGTLRSYPSVEAIGEFKLVRSNFNAEYGRSGGGFQVFTTRSGGNEFHGALFEYLRNNAFDARGFFARNVPGNKQHEFGASFSGPVIFPKLYNGKNRSFFFFNYTGFRFRQEVANTFASFAPTEFRQGDFSRLTDRNGNPMMIYDPATTASAAGGFTRQPFAGNRIPQTRISRVSRNIVPLLPQLGNNDLLNNFLTIGNNRIDSDQYNLKADHSFSDRSRLSAFISTSERPGLGPLNLPIPFTNARQTYNAPRWGRVTHDYVISSRTLHQFLAGATRERGGGDMVVANQGWPEKIGLTGINTGPGNTFPVVTFNDGYTSWGEAGGGRSVGGQINNMMQITDTLSHVAGKHSLKMGVDLRWLQTNGAEWLWNQGRFGFSSFTTAAPTAQGRANSGSSIASFLLGEVDNAFRRVQEIYPSNRYRYFSTFLQDDWKVTRKLTLNLGLRYEINYPRWAHRDDQSSFDPTTPNPGAGNRPGAIVFWGGGPGRIGRRSYADTDYRNFGPRFGLAYQLNQRTVLRGGYGIFFAPGNATAGLRLSTGFSYGLSVQPTYASTDQGVTSAINWDNGFPTNFAQPPVFDPAVANGSAVNMLGRRDGRPPYLQSYTLSIQRELPGNIVLETTYAGNKGTRLGNGLISINQLSPDLLGLGALLTRPFNSPEAIAANIREPYPGFRGSVAQALRPFPQYQSIDNVSDPNGNSTYHAFQLSAEKRMGQGVSFLLAYTFAKTISDGDTQAGGGAAGQTFHNRRLEKAISPNDIPQVFSLSYLYELPFGKGKRLLNSGAASVLAGGWTITGIHQYNAGTPVTLTANNTLPLFNSALRPDAIGGVEKRLAFADPATDRYINPAAFRAPAPFQFGTAARGYTDLRRFPFLNESFGLIKRTALKERFVVVFRAEFFNAFNRTVFAAPQSNVSNADFGRVRGQSGTPRQGQLALRLEF